MTGHAVLEVSPWKKKIQSFLHLCSLQSFPLCCFLELTHSTFQKNSVIWWRVKKSEIGRRTENFQVCLCVYACVH